MHACGNFRAASLHGEVRNVGRLCTLYTCTPVSRDGLDHQTQQKLTIWRSDHACLSPAANPSPHLHRSPLEARCMHAVSSTTYSYPIYQYIL